MKAGGLPGAEEAHEKQQGKVADRARIIGDLGELWPAVEGAPQSHVSIIGIGASAGGLEAFERFFHACPADTGMAFVLISHLDPNRQSLLAEILQRSTLMPVHEASDQITVAPNHVYIIPPNREMGILNGMLQLSELSMDRGQRMPIDAFMRALADDQAENAIGIILSGTGSDGSLGLRAILGVGGICMVQEPSTAKYDGMPTSVITAGCATHILSVENMPAALQGLIKQTVCRRRVARIPHEALDDKHQPDSAANLQQHRS